MNKLYFAIVDDDVGGCYISAPSVKEAKKLAMYEPLVHDYLEIYIDLKCHCCRDKDGKIRRTKIGTGVLTMQGIFDEKLEWFGCPKCEENIKESEKGYKALDDSKCECLDCGHIFEIPYV